METAVVDAFEQSRWQRKVGTPFTWVCKADQHRRLLNVIYQLNSGQENHLIKFHSCGGGAFVWWEDLRPTS